MTPPLRSPISPSIPMASSRPEPSPLAQRLHAVENARRRQEEARRQISQYQGITGGEFAVEMLLGVPRGFGRMWRDTCNHPFVVGGVVLGILLLGTKLPHRHAQIFSRGLLWLGGATSGIFIVKGAWNGVEAWQSDDRAALREASTDLGIGLISVGMAYAGYRIAKHFGSTPEAAQRWGAVGTVLHSSDEIAATLALIRGFSGVGNGSAAY